MFFCQLKHALYCVLEAWHQDPSNENHMKQFSLINVQRALLRDDYSFHLRNKFNFSFTLQETQCIHDSMNRPFCSHFIVINYLILYKKIIIILETK